MSFPLAHPETRDKNRDRHAQRMGRFDRAPLFGSQFRIPSLNGPLHRIRHILDPRRGEWTCSGAMGRPGAIDRAHCAATRTGRKAPGLSASSGIRPTLRIVFTETSA